MTTTGRGYDRPAGLNPRSGGSGEIAGPPVSPRLVGINRGVDPLPLAKHQGEIGDCVDCGGATFYAVSTFEGRAFLCGYCEADRRA